MCGIGFNNVKLTDKDVYEILFLNKVKGLQPYEIEKGSLYLGQPLKIL